jgi:tripartite-type tricarboxylate transporter receptor subunit TctC
VGRMLVGYPPGGAADLIARVFAERLRGTYAPQVVVENRTGAAARLAVEAAKAAPPDGATMLMTPESALVVYPHIYPRTLRYDPLRDFVPAGGLTSTGLCLLVAANHPARDFRGFVEWARGRSEIPYASPAAGSTPFLMAQQMASTLGLNLSHVSYRGTGPALPDLLGGLISAIAGVTGDWVEQHKAGRIRVLAVSSTERSPGLPEVPTLAELGHPALTTESWYMMLLPAGTPAPLVEALNRALAAATRVPEVRDSLLRMEQVPRPVAPQEVAARIRGETERWGPIVRATGFTAEE